MYRLLVLKSNDGSIHAVLAESETLEEALQTCPLLFEGQGHKYVGEVRLDFPELPPGERQRVEKVRDCLLQLDSLMEGGIATLLEELTASAYALPQQHPSS